MKILHVIDNMDMGGAQSLLLELVPVQQKMGNEVLILELRKAGDSTLSTKLLNKGVEIKALSDSKSVRNITHIFSLIPYLKTYDIVHVHLFPANYWVALAKLFSRSLTPIITTEHSTTNKRRKIPMFKYMDNFIYRLYNEVVACSNKAFDTFHSRYSKVHCISIPNGVDVSNYINAEKYSKYELLGLREDVFLVTMVARFAYPKRQDVVVKAIAQLPEKFHIAFVGGDPRDTELLKVKELAESLKISERVHFLYLRSDVNRILKSSDVVVMASEYEGLSLSSIEGMACGHPFIASNVNGLCDVVDGAGLLFECENFQQLSEIIFELSQDKQLYTTITKRCMVRASEYDIHIMASKYQKVYNKLLAF